MKQNVLSSMICIGNLGDSNTVNIYVPIWIMKEYLVIMLNWYELLWYATNCFGSTFYVVAGFGSCYWEGYLIRELCIVW